MKKLYEKPEAEVVTLMSEQDLANEGFIPGDTELDSNNIFPF